MLFSTILYHWACYDVNASRVLQDSVAMTFLRNTKWEVRQKLLCYWNSPQMFLKTLFLQKTLPRGYRGKGLLFLYLYYLLLCFIYSTHLSLLLTIFCEVATSRLFLPPEQCLSNFSLKYISKLWHHAH